MPRAMLQPAGCCSIRGLRAVVLAAATTMGLQQQPLLPTSFSELRSNPE